MVKPWMTALDWSKQPSQVRRWAARRSAVQVPIGSPHQATSPACGSTKPPSTQADHWTASARPTDGPAVTTEPEQAIPTEVETCRVPMPQEWRELLGRPAGAEGEPYALLIAASADGHRFDAQYGGAEPGQPSPVVFLWTHPDGSSHVVMDLGESPGTQVFAGDFDGRYVAFSVYEHAEIVASPWVGYVYDVQNPGQPPKEFARSTEGTYPDGSVGALPLMSPLVQDGTVYWVAFEPLDESGYDRTLFSYDIADDSVRPVATGEFETPHFFRDSILTISLSGDRAQSSIVQIPVGETAVDLSDQMGAGSLISHIAASGESLAWIAENQVFLLEPGARGPVSLVGPDGTFGTESVHEPATIDMNDELVIFYAENSHDTVQQYVFDRRSNSYFSNEDVTGASADFAVDSGVVSLHHTDEQGNRLVGRPVVAAMDDLPPLPTCS